MKNKERETQLTKRRVDTHFASNRTQELMFQIAMWRESRGLNPESEAPLYRREGLRQRQMQEGQEYEF